MDFFRNDHEEQWGRTKHQSYIDYSNSSIDITKEMCHCLIRNNFYSSDSIENIKALERGLINYSILKLFDWNIKVADLDMAKLEDLESLCQILDSRIPSHSTKDFFIQYIHCITYCLGVINKQNQISLLEVESNEPINIVVDNGIIKEIIISAYAPYYTMPSMLLDNVKKLYKNEKIPVLKK